MTEINRQRNNSVLSFFISLILSYVIEIITGFNYKASVDGLDYRILIAFLIMFVPFYILYNFFERVDFNKSNENDKK